LGIIREFQMKIRMQPILKRWIGYEVDAIMGSEHEVIRADAMVQVLAALARSGDAERYVRRNGKLAWRATKRFIEEIRAEELENNEVDEHSRR
jgi:hypothetical protein